ncbi:MAG: helix-turn-helix domain-containing protein [Actinomycetota bacterium]
MPGSAPSAAVLTVSETARLLRISRGAAYEAIRTGQIPHLRIGRRILVPTALLMRLLGAETEGGPAITGPPSSPSSRPQTKGGTA